MKVISLILSVSMFVSTISYAECDFSTGITKVDNGYLYTIECHKEVGKLVKDNADQATQINYLKEAMKYQDDMIAKERQRAELWRDYSYKAEDRMMSLQKYNQMSGWLYFGLGIVTTVAAGFALGQVNKAGK